MREQADKSAGSRIKLYEHHYLVTLSGVVVEKYINLSIWPFLTSSRYTAKTIITFLPYSSGIWAKGKNNSRFFLAVLL